MNRKVVLVVAAHPDDEILGCGGTVAKLSQDCDVYSLVLGEGVTSRDNKRQRGKRRSQLLALQKQMKQANKILGVKKVSCISLPDNRFDTIALLDITKHIEKVITKLKPHAIYTHFGNDLNIDHQITFQAVLTASRPLPGQSVQELYAFETMSSTEFNFPLTFQPDTFSQITGHLKTKLKALSVYTTEMMAFPHQRSLESVSLTAQYWGVRTGLIEAEAFMTVRKLW